MSSTSSDNTTFDTKAAVEAAKNNKGYYKTLTLQQRTQVFNYLNSIEYNYPENEPPKMDRIVFSMRNKVIISLYI